jgi:uncharacterized membrane protein
MDGGWLFNSLVLYLIRRPVPWGRQLFFTGASFLLGLLAAMRAWNHYPAGMIWRGEINSWAAGDKASSAGIVLKMKLYKYKYNKNKEKERIRMEMPDSDMRYSSEDIEKNKAVAILAYILFFVPLLAARESKFAMYHANQGLVLFLAAVIVNVLGSVIPFIGWFVILPLGNLAVVVLVVLGIINVCKGEAKPLPLLGGIKILK